MSVGFNRILSWENVASNYTMLYFVTNHSNIAAKCQAECREPLQDVNQE